jgi:SAM-dependent methyltransferase
VLTVETLARLQGPEGEHLLAAAAAALATAPTLLAALTRLRARYPAELAAAALETVTLRQQAREKFACAERMFFTREGLEQATSETVARYTARRYTAFAHVVDLGCGIGGDTLALADVAPVTAIDRDPLRLALAAANAATCRPRHPIAFLRADIIRDPLPAAPAAFCDPARRNERGRVFAPDRYEPPLAAVLALAERYPALGVKVAPGIGDDALPPGCEVEFVQAGRDLKQATLWLGLLATATRRATLLPGGETLAFDPDVPPAPLSEPRAVLYEPGPAAVRARLVARLALDLHAAQLDPTTAFLTADRFLPTPFAAAYAVEEWQPFNLKRLRARLHALGVGRLTIKKRGSPLEPAALARDLRLDGLEERVLVLTRLNGRHIAIICRSLGAIETAASGIDADSRLTGQGVTS